MFAMASPPRTPDEVQRHFEGAMLVGWFFLACVLVMFGSVIRPAWRAKWRWGRRSPGAPMSALGRGAWIACFLLWSLALLGEGYQVLPISKSGPALFLGLGMVFLAAIYDWWYFKS